MYIYIDYTIAEMALHLPHSSIIEHKERSMICGCPKVRFSELSAL